MRTGNLPSIFVILMVLLTVMGRSAHPAEALLSLEHKLRLGMVTGRIDHLAIDVKRNRLFVAELGNGSVAIVDLMTQVILKRITGLHEPQGVAYEPTADRLYIANGGDGVLKILSGEQLSPIGEVHLGEDADNIRLAGPGRILVGYGSGAISIIQAGQKVADLPLAAHPEAFQRDLAAGRLFVNEPDAHGIEVIDEATGRKRGIWGAPGLKDNFPMAFDSAGHRLFVVYRSPATLAVFHSTTGKMLQKIPTCRDADDVFFDAKRSQLYVSCGEGFLATVRMTNGKLAEAERMRTRKGARTSLFVPELDRFFLAVRASEGQPAEIWVYRPTP